MLLELLFHFIDGITENEVITRDCKGQQLIIEGLYTFDQILVSFHSDSIDGEFGVFSCKKILFVLFEYFDEFEGDFSQEENVALFVVDHYEIKYFEALDEDGFGFRDDFFVQLVVVVDDFIVESLFHKVVDLFEWQL